MFGEGNAQGLDIVKISHCQMIRYQISFFPFPALSKSKVFVDQKQQALNESGDFVIPGKQRSYDVSMIQGDLCDVIAGKIEGRRSKEEITLFKSVGIALEDIAVGRLAYELGVRQGARSRNQSALTDWEPQKQEFKSTFQGQ